MKTAIGTLLALSLAAGFAGCGSGGRSGVAPSLAGVDSRIDPSRGPRSGEMARVPATVPDPAGLSGEIGLPTGSADEITFYFSLPVDDFTLVEAAKVDDDAWHGLVPALLYELRGRGSYVWCQGN
jgi:hypothetical protein